jgi:hypothetical protein
MFSGGIGNVTRAALSRSRWNYFRPLNFFAIQKACSNTDRRTVGPQLQQLLHQISVARPVGERHNQPVVTIRFHRQNFGVRGHETRYSCPGQSS